MTEVEPVQVVGRSFVGFHAQQVEPPMQFVQLFKKFNEVINVDTLDF
jgi:hypothetical protein